VIILERVFHAKLFTIVLGIAILRLFFDKTVYSLSSLKFLFFIWILFIILRFFFLYLGYNILTKDVDIKLLKKGMIPAEKVYFENGKYKKESMLYFSLFSYLYEKTKKRKYLFETTAEGLSEGDVEKLKRMEKKLGFEHLRIHQTLSFAPFMFVGTLLTILFHGNLFIALALL
jgi:prepilin signal peptidase PulO-like enzyme (type II secretory pathway)